MGLYRIWINPRGVGRHAVGREYPAGPTFHVDIEARDLAAAKKDAASSPYWTGEIVALRAGDSVVKGGRAEREKAAWWATHPKDRRSDPLEVRVNGRWVALSKMRPEALRTYHRRVVNALRSQTRAAHTRLYGSAEITSSRHIGYEHYRITDKEAAALAHAAGKKLPRGGYQLSVQLPDGRMAWLQRTPYAIGHRLGSGYATARDVPKRGWVWSIYHRGAR